MKKLVICLVAAVACSASGTARAQVTAEDLAKLEKRIEALEKAGKDNAKDLADIKKMLEAVHDHVKDTDTKLKDLVKSDASNAGRSVQDLLGNMERSPAVRTEVDKLLTGRLVVENNTGLDQYMYINGVLWRVIPGTSYAPVNRGVVTVQRLGSAAEVINDWQFSAARGNFVSYRYPQGVVTLLPVMYGY